MKTLKKIALYLVLAALVITAAVMLTSCKKDSKNVPKQQQTTQPAPTPTYTYNVSVMSYRSKSYYVSDTTGHLIVKVNGKQIIELFDTQIPDYKAADLVLKTGDKLYIYYDPGHKNEQQYNSITDKWEFIPVNNALEVIFVGGYKPPFLTMACQCAKTIDFTVAE